jgi:hypothetical protein
MTDDRGQKTDDARQIAAEILNIGYWLFDIGLGRPILFLFSNND